ncbi:MAG: nitroreductase family protein [Paludibacter sp.]
MLKKTLQWLVPKKVRDFRKRKLNNYSLKKELKAAYLYDLNRYLKYTDAFGSDIETNLISRIIRNYHVIEKGLTMPEARLGFGRNNLITLVMDCLKYIQKYGKEDEQIIHAIGVILEYELFHHQKKFKLDNEIVYYIETIRNNIENIAVCSQVETTKNEYFKYSNCSFPEFANSRSSIRNYSKEEIPTERIINALELARNTPSACNRQCWRTYIYSDKTEICNILEIQGGNRGFGHLTNKLIVIAAEVGVFSNIAERNEAYIDGGIYAMNLLYAIHYQRIAGCILNCSNTIEKDIKLRKICKIKDSEVFIAMIACGIPPETFYVASSKRYNLEKTNKIF